ncbi:sugar phosphate isomerase/epimerase [Emticicia sp. TH156]|uniref:sugar phosphate isomerase/epimerase family protein n=1 Tax=Emticicia sp. TH156 TaxID=2067454 RepID=UPI000C7945FC|nr:sugar phosphate isomerase/epimerase [Emticicia sp. TH156]PLK43434.1 xylose isomerase [Emticicia sp. TH156]
MLNRRDFLRNSGVLALGGLAWQGQAKDLLNFRPKFEPGVQLFTTLSVIDKDVSGTLKQIAAIGYKNIESAFSMKGGYYGMKPKEFATLVKDLGMTWQSHHVMGAPFRMLMPAQTDPKAPARPMPKLPPIKDLMNNMQEVVDDAAEGGVKYLVCATTPVKTLDEVKQSLEVLQKTGEACKKAGITFAFHNHSAEFEPVEGQLPFDVFASQTSADILKFELDIAWAIKAGVDPVALFAKHKGRFPLWHVKDLSKDKQMPVEIGKGYIDYTPVFAAAKTAGMKYYFVEQDGAPSPVDNLTTSYNTLKKVVGA